jgi:hypothetical protein
MPVIELALSFIVQLPILPIRPGRIEKLANDSRQSLELSTIAQRRTPKQSMVIR